MGKQMNNYIVVIPIKTLNVGDELLAHYSYRIPTLTCKVGTLQLGDDKNVIIHPGPKPKKKKLIYYSCV